MRRGKLAVLLADGVGLGLVSVAAAQQKDAKGVVAVRQATMDANAKHAGAIEAQGGTVAGVGTVLARFAADRPHDELVTLVHGVLQRLDQDGPEPDPTEERFLSRARHADGQGFSQRAQSGDPPAQGLPG